MLEVSEVQGNCLNGRNPIMSRIERLLGSMDAWRHLPAYQLERRADIFFSIYLADLLQERFGLSIADVVPEFPIRIGTIHPKNSALNLAFKVDYLVKVSGASTVYFIELKTDDSSRRSTQDWYLGRAQEVGMAGLLDGIRLICAATTSKKKYRRLLGKLHDMGLIALAHDGTFTVPPAPRDIKIIYIQPNNKEGRDNVISFCDAAAIIGQYGDDLSQRFAQSLTDWADVRAGDGGNGSRA